MSTFTLKTHLPLH